MSHRHPVLIFLLLVLPSMQLLRSQNDSGESDPRVQQLYLQAKTAQSKGDIAGAITGYREILRIAPRLGPAYNNLGALYFRQRDYKAAADVLEHGLKLNPGMPSASALLGISLYESGEYLKARPRLEAAVKANPADENTQLYLVKDLSKLSEYQTASSQLQQLASRQPKNQEVWYLLAKTYMKLSEQALAKMNSIDPDSVLSHELSAEVMESMNNYDGAVVELKKAVEMDPQKPGTHFKLGEAYRGLDQWDAALDQFQAELALDPANCQAQWKIGATQLQNNGNAEQALAGINKALNLCPGMTEARVDRARALIKLNRNKDAVTDLEAAVKAQPAEASNHFLLAKTYRSLGRMQEAQTEMQIFSNLEESARTATAERAQEVIKNKQSPR